MGVRKAFVIEPLVIETFIDNGKINFSASDVGSAVVVQDAHVEMHVRCYRKDFLADDLLNSEAEFVVKQYFKVAFGLIRLKSRKLFVEFPILFGQVADEGSDFRSLGRNLEAFVSPYEQLVGKNFAQTGDRPGDGRVRHLQFFCHPARAA